MNDDEVIRSFIAIEISDEVRERFRALQQDLKKVGARVGWVAPENIHLTLVFLGDIFRSQIESVSAAIDAVVAQTACFRYDIAGSGLFGSPRSPRVMWVGIDEPGQEITALQVSLGTAIRGLGIKIEDRTFHPHLTLGRIRARDRVDELTSRWASVKSTAYGSVEVRRLRLMQSHLEHQGVRYSVLHESTLKGAT